METGRQLQILPSFFFLFCLRCLRLCIHLSESMVENIANHASKVEV